MRTNKILLIIQTAIMYLAQLPLWGILFFTIFAYEDSYAIRISDLLGLIYRLGTLLTVAISIIHILYAIIKRSDKDVSKFTMIIKIVQLPWHLVNTFFCILTIIGIIFNPSLALATPLITLMFIVVTEIYTLSTSLPEFIAYPKKITNEEMPFSWIGVLSCVVLFWHPLDLVGSILLYYVTYGKKKDPVK